MNSTFTLYAMLMGFLMFALCLSLARAGGRLYFAQPEGFDGQPNLNTEGTLTADQPEEAPGENGQEEVESAPEAPPKIIQEDGYTLEDLQENIEYDTPDFSDISDFKVDTLPYEDIITFEQARLKPGHIGELDFTVDPGWQAVLRVAPDSRGINLDDFDTICEEKATDITVDGTQVRIFDTAGGSSLFLWNKDGFDYVLYFEDTEMGLGTGTVGLFQEQTDSSRTDAPNPEDITEETVDNNDQP